MFSIVRINRQLTTAREYIDTVNKSMNEHDSVLIYEMCKVRDELAELIDDCEYDRELEAELDESVISQLRQRVKELDKILFERMNERCKDINAKLMKTSKQASSIIADQKAALKELENATN